MKCKLSFFAIRLRSTFNDLSGLTTRRTLSLASCLNIPVEKTTEACEPFWASSEFKQDCQTKVLKVAFIGLPNAGKSTLINQLIGRQLCPISCKSHTTRISAKCVQIEGMTQLVYLDTPGLVTEEEFKRFRLSESFRSAAIHALKEANIIGVIHDAANINKRLHLDPVIMHLLETFSSKTSVLVLNKIDLIKKKRLLMGISNTLTQDKTKSTKKKIGKEDGLVPGAWPFFKEVFYVSAETGDGVGDIKAYLLMQAKAGPWPFTADAVTDRPLEKLIVESLQASMLDALPQEIPRLLKIHLLNLEESVNGAFYATLKVEAKRERHIRIILGAEGLTLRKICSIAETNLASAFRTPIFLKVAVTSQEKDH